MSPVRWRWEEKDFGFRFRTGKGKHTSEHYQATNEGDFYLVPPYQSKLEFARRDELTATWMAPASPNIVAMPWRNYDQHWDHIYTDDGITFNYAGCLDEEEIKRQEDAGVSRAMEYVTALVEGGDRALKYVAALIARGERAMEYVEGLVAENEPVPLSIPLVRQIHIELMGGIYPFAGEWRTVNLTKGEGPTKWPLPQVGIGPLIDDLGIKVFSRSPFMSPNNEEVYTYVSEVMNELLAIHPFREGNGRTAFILGNLVLMQNNLLPLNRYDRQVDEKRYYEACESGRIRADYAPLAQLIGEWEARELDRWNT